MGVADLIPGVSGGTIALLYGIYDELLLSIKVVTGRVPKAMLQGKFKHAWNLIPFSFLLPIFIGIVVALIALVQIITHLLEAYPVYIWSLFFGLIVGSAYLISKRIRRWSVSSYAFAASGAIGAYLLVGLPAVSAEVSMLAMVATGAIAICAMVLPGISGSLIMVLLGQYENVITALSELQLKLLAAFAVGALGGLAFFSRLLSWLLHRYHAATLAFLVGLMLGALRTVWPWKVEAGHETFTAYMPELNGTVLVALLLMAAGGYTVWQLEKLGVAQEHEDDLPDTVTREER